MTRTPSPINVIFLLTHALFFAACLPDGDPLVFGAVAPSPCLTIGAGDAGGAGGADGGGSSFAAAGSAAGGQSGAGAGGASGPVSGSAGSGGAGGDAATSGSGGGTGAISCALDCELAGVGRCTGETCVVDCGAPGAPAGCASKVTCPTGLSCEIWGAVAPLGIDCLAAKSCDIYCNFGCEGPILCGGDACLVACSSAGTCQGTISCQAKQCDITCESATSCAGEVSCGGADCSVGCQQPGSCSGGVCCAASSCAVTGVQNSCP